MITIVGNERSPNTHIEQSEKLRHFGVALSAGRLGLQGLESLQEGRENLLPPETKSPHMRDTRTCSPLKPNHPTRRASLPSTSRRKFKQTRTATTT